MRNHFNKHGEVKGAEITIGETTTKTDYWNLKLWLKRTSDMTYPDSKGYFWMLLDWRSRPDPVS
ncbi:GSCOCT00014196001.2-RA-CDS [Cotesia congregata]|uniref:Cc_bv6.14_28.19_pseudo n=1 Tax=Cotesia congregata TaxID=51543 RepID=A0A8J2MKI6_COTCN|nr:GSCOCT00014196001.2-RA-CDS [Cotesia congregata]CAG5092498.1 cc_bv6.14_28.19_pseudo [Cotesia congregata]